MELVQSLTLAVDRSRPLSELLGAAGFDTVHFFITEGIAQGLVPEDTDGPVEGGYALVSVPDAKAGLEPRHVDALRAQGREPATLRELLSFALAHPEAQRTRDMVALGSIRTRRLSEHGSGETVWTQTEIDHGCGQWVVALGGSERRRTMVPVELYLKDVLVRETVTLVRVGKG